jgi:hypothetical protein
MSELLVTKEKVLEAALKCEEAKKVLKTLFPEVFEQKWEVFIPEVKVHKGGSSEKPYIYIYLCDAGGQFGTIKKTGVDIVDVYKERIRFSVVDHYRPGDSSADEYRFEHLVK